MARTTSPGSRVLGLVKTVRNYVVAIWAWDLWLGLGFGGFAGVVAMVPDVRRAAVTLLIAEAAIGVALLATVLTGLGIFATFFDRAYRRVLEEAGEGDLRQALEPYAIVAFVGATTAVLGTVSAVAYPALAPAIQGTLLGFTTGFCVWAIAGCASLAELTIFHARSRASLMRSIDDAREARTRTPASRGRTRTKQV